MCCSPPSIKNMLFNLCTFTKLIRSPVLYPIYHFTLVVLLSAFLHWILIYIYITMCVPTTFKGLLLTTISLGSPFCTFINTVQYELSRNYILIWASAATATFTYAIAQLQR